MRDPQKMAILGRIGEELAPRLLERAGFTDIRDLNTERRNHEDADLLALRDGLHFLVSVKARNKWTKDGTKVNPRYKLHSKNRSCFDALETARLYEAEFAWFIVVPRIQTRQ